MNVEDNGAIELSIDPATLEQIRQAIMYGPMSEDVEDKSPTVAPETPAEYSTGRIHVKMKPGTRLDKADGVSSLYDAAGKSIDAEALYYLDYEFPNLQIKPLWGDTDKLDKLKARGEENSGKELPDLSLWMEVTPVPNVVVKEMIDGGEAGMPLLEKEAAQCIDRTLEILKTMPEVETAHAIPPFVQSSWPDMFHENYTTDVNWYSFIIWLLLNTNPPINLFGYSWSGTSNWTRHQPQTAPDIYYTGGDYDRELAVSDLQTAPLEVQCEDGDYDSTACMLGGLNVWPAWDRCFKGENIPIGYVEADWCLDPEPGEYYTVSCSTHPDLDNFHANHLEHVTSDRRVIGGFSFQHGTSVLGIMAADHEYDPDDKDGGMGISPESSYYIGQVANTVEWIDIATRLINDANGAGAIFLLEAPLGCYVQDLVEDGEGACPIEVWPEFQDFISTITANDIVALNIP